jgi:hypothetical protein
MEPVALKATEQMRAWWRETRPPTVPTSDQGLRPKLCVVDARVSRG